MLAQTIHTQLHRYMGHFRYPFLPWKYWKVLQPSRELARIDYQELEWSYCPRWYCPSLGRFCIRKENSFRIANGDFEWKNVLNPRQSWSPESNLLWSTWCDIDQEFISDHIGTPNIPGFFASSDHPPWRRLDNCHGHIKMFHPPEGSNLTQPIKWASGQRYDLEIERHH